MKLEGSHSIAGAREQVWALLVKPESLAKCLPGCQTLEPSGDDIYEMQLHITVAAITGSYKGQVQIIESIFPQRLRLRVSGRGATGFLNGEGTIELSEQKGMTNMRYQGEVHVGGMIAAVGHRVIEGVARMIINQFFERLATLLRSPENAVSPTRSDSAG